MWILKEINSLARRNPFMIASVGKICRDGGVVGRQQQPVSGA
jgi:hypothetical protein